MSKRILRKFLAIFLTAAIATSVLLAMASPVSAADVEETVEVNTELMLEAWILFEGCNYDHWYLKSFTQPTDGTHYGHLYYEDGVTEYLYDTEYDIIPDYVIFKASEPGVYTFYCTLYDDIIMIPYTSTSVQITVGSSETAPTVTTQDVTGIGTTTATGHGNITDIGSSDVTAYGVCWNTTGTPTTDNNNTNEGSTSATGAFTSSMTELTPGTEYYVRAYATNTTGTSYGDQVTFTAEKIGLTVSGLTGDNKTYDGNTTATATGTAALSGVESGDTVTLDGTPVFTFASANTGTGISISTTGYTLGGEDAGKYSLTQPTLSADITAKTLTVSGVTGNDKTYDGNTDATLNTSEYSFTGVVEGDTVTLDSESYTATFAGKNVNTDITVTVSGLALGGADAANYTLTQPSLTADITAKTLTVSGLTGDDKVYDGNTTATASGTAALAGVVSGDTVTLDGTSVFTFASANAGAEISISTTGYTLGGEDAANYTLTQPTLSADITAKELTVSGLTGYNKVYDGNTTAGATGTAALAGVVSEDTVTLDGTPVFTFASANVGTEISISTTGYTLGGADAANYTLTQPSLSADITAKTLIVSGVTGNDKTYDGNTDATLNAEEYSFTGVVSGDTVTLDTSSYTAAFADKNVNTDITVTVSGLALGGEDAANYTLTQPSLTADITAKGLTISGLTGYNKVYDGNTTAGATGTAALSGVVSGDTVTLDGTPVFTFASANAGTGISISTTGYTLGGEDAANYTLTQPTLSADITAKELTVSNLTGYNKVYDGNTTAGATGTAALAGVVSEDTVTLDGTPVFTFASANAGTDISISTAGYTLSGEDATNYTLTQPTLSADITAKTLIVSGVTGNDKVYDGNTDATLNTSEYFFTGVVPEDTVTLDTSSYTATFADKNVNTDITVTVSGLALGGDDAANYTFTQPTLSADITAKTLTVSGLTGYNKVYDGNTTAGATGTAALSGVVSGDTVTLDGTPVFTFASANAGTGISISTTGYTLGGEDAANYSLTQPTLSADITAKELTVSGLTGSNKVYDGNADASASGTAALSGVVSEDTVTLDGTPVFTFASANVGTAISISTTGYTLGGADAANYTLTQPTLSADITAKTLTVSGITADKVYDGNTEATLNTSEYSFTGVVSEDTVTLDTSSYTATFADKNVNTDITVTVSGLALGGADAANYTLTQPTLSADITAKGLTVNGLTGDNKVYDGNTTASVSGTAALSGVVSEDTVTLGGTPVFTFASANAGTEISISTTGYTLGGEDAANYTLTQPTLSADITAKGLTVSGLTGDNKTYDGNTDASASGTAALAGVVSEDTVTLDGTPVFTFASANVGTAISISTTGYTISGEDSANYTLTQPSFSTDITAKELTVSGLTGSNKVYDGDTTASASGTAALSGVVSEDTVTLDGTPVFTFASANAGTEISISTTGYTLGGGDSANYTLTQPTLSADITAKGLTVSGLTGSNKVYDGNTTASASGKESLEGVVSEDTVTLDGTPVFTFASANVGTGISISTTDYTLGGEDAANYSLTQPTLSADITAKTLTVSGITADKVYDGNTTASLNTTEHAFTGVVSGDTVTLDTSSYTAAFADENVNTDITVTVSGLALGGADAANYTLTQPTISADITAKALTVSGITADKVYDSTTDATLDTSEYAFTDVVSGDTVTLDTSSYTATFADENVNTDITVTVSGLALDGEDAANYTLTQPTLSADITAKELTVSGLTGSNKVYDGNTTAGATGTLVLEGIISGDTVRLEGSPVFTFASADVGTDISISTTGYTLGGEDAANYSLTQPSLSADITASEMKIEGNNIEIVNGDTTPSTDDYTILGSAYVFNSITRTFVIKNTGSEDLNLTGSTKIVISGTNVSDFTVTSQPDTIVAPGDTTTFNVTFRPIVAGVRTATISIANNDPYANPYTFTIQGTGRTSSSGSGSVYVPPVTTTPTTTPTTVPTTTPTTTSTELPGQLQVNVEDQSDIITITGSGVVQGTATVTSTDKEITIIIPDGTTVLTKDNTPPMQITITPDEDPPSPPAASNFIGVPYECLPSGTTFSTPITLVWNYDPATLPAGTDETMLTVALYNEATGQWEAIEGVVDTVNHTVSAFISHFSIYAIVTSEDQATVTPAAPISDTSTNNNTWLIVGIIAGVVAAVTILGLLIRRKQRI